MFRQDTAFAEPKLLVPEPRALLGRLSALERRSPTRHTPIFGCGGKDLVMRKCAVTGQGVSARVEANRRRTRGWLLPLLHPMEEREFSPNRLGRAP